MTLVNFHELLLRTCHFKFCTISELVQDGFINSFKPTVRFPLTRALDESRHYRNKFSGVPRFEPRAAGWQVKSRHKRKNVAVLPGKNKYWHRKHTFCDARPARFVVVYFLLHHWNAQISLPLYNAKMHVFSVNCQGNKNHGLRGQFCHSNLTERGLHETSFCFREGGECLHQGILRNVIRTLYPARPFRSVWELLFLPGLVGVHRHPSMAELFLT